MLIRKSTKLKGLCVQQLLAEAFFIIMSSPIKVEGVCECLDPSFETMKYVIRGRKKR